MRNHVRLSPSGPFIGASIASLVSALGPTSPLGKTAGAGSSPIADLELTFDNADVKVGQSVLWTVSGEIISDAGVNGIAQFTATLIQPDGTGSALTPAALQKTIPTATTPYDYSITLLGAITDAGTGDVTIQFSIGAVNQDLTIAANRTRTIAYLIG